MRYLIDKTDYPVELYPVYQDPFERKFGIGVHTYVFVCKKCGAHLYSEFEFEKDTASRVTKIRKKEHDLWYGDKIAVQYSRYRSDAERRDVLEKIEAQKKMLDEVRTNNKRSEENYLSSLVAAVCPICGAKLLQEKGYFLPDGRMYELQNGHRLKNRQDKEAAMNELYGVFIGDRDSDDYTVDGKFNALEDIRKNIEQEQVNTSVNDYSRYCDIFVTANGSPKTAEIKRDVETLKSYILNLIRLENNIYSLQQQLTELYYRRIGNDRAIVFDTYGPAYQIKTELKELQKAYQVAMEAISDAEKYQPDVHIHYPDVPRLPILGEPGLFNRKKVLAENDALMKKYYADMEAYEEECRRCDKEKERLIIEERNVVIEKAKKKAAEAKNKLDSEVPVAKIKIAELQSWPVPARAVKVLLDQEISTTEELLKKSYAARNELYAYNIIFGKYRNTVALSSFYEYLMSGRCSALEGTDGAYNIYESEIRMNHVISQLDQVIDSLEQIKENQYMVYQEMRMTNSLLSNLNSTMDTALTSIQGIEANTTQMKEYMGRIAKNSDVIAHNSAVTAYYSKVNAELTNAMGFMMAYKL